jgi:DNA-binding PadR family transcriptional regulator
MGNLPLTEPVLLVLLSLAEQPRHGYSIMKDVKQMSAGRVLLSTGTLYGALQRLLAQGWIERFEEDEGSRDRRAYRLTSRASEPSIRNRAHAATHKGGEPSSVAQRGLDQWSVFIGVCFGFIPTGIGASMRTR